MKPWLKPWNAELAAERISRPLRSNGVPYRGINILMLWSEAIDRGFDSPIWMTFKQARDLGAAVRKGEKGTPIVFADKIVRTETDAATGEESNHAFPFLKSYTVLNVAQVDGLPERFHLKPAAPSASIARLDTCDLFFARTKAEIRHGGTMAYYNIGQDFVQMPPLETFRDTESYYATLSHEVTHWTRHKSRLDREFGRKRFGDEGYAMEELVAELGSAFLCADLGLAPEPRDDHASYIASWIKVLKNDKRAIFSAAAHAQRATEYLNGFTEDLDAATAA